MRRLLAAVLFVCVASLARAGVLVELTDGTKLTVESHWNDGQQVHLVRGGVDMIVSKSQIKSLDENVKDPEVYTDHGAEQDAPVDAAHLAPPAAGTTEAKAPAPQASDPALSQMSAADLEALQKKEANRLREMQEKRFNAAYGGAATPQQQRQAEESVAEQNKRTTQVWTALQQAKKAESGDEQPQ